MAILDASGRIGELVPILVEDQRYHSYVPQDLPFDPPLQYDPTIQRLLQEAYLAVGRLDGAAAILPNLAELQYIYLFKEAVLSSQIEGTQSSLEDFLAYEEGKKLNDNPLDIAEVFNYVPAVQYGLTEVKRHGFTVELIESLHGNLITKERGDLRKMAAYAPGRTTLSGGIRPSFRRRRN